MNPAKLFRLLSEFLMFLLGGLLVLLAVTGRVGRPARPGGFIFLGAVLVYWGLRGWMRAKQGKPRFLQITQAVSLALLGAAVVGISLAGVQYTALLLGVAGVSLVLRGLLGALYLLSHSDSATVPQP
jgi:hypothetical protein